jgi:threonine/homoserine/homoserine lactone efflux protein
MTADFVIIYIIYLGLGPFFTSNMVQIILGLIGAIMLIYMGVQNTRTNNNSKNEELDFETAAKAIDKKSFTTGFLLAIANPLNIVFWTGIYGALLTVETTNLNTPLLLIVSIFLGISISNITLAVMSAAGRSYVKPSNLRFISFSSGIILIGYGVWIGYSTMSSNLDVDLLALFA